MSVAPAFDQSTITAGPTFEKRAGAVLVSWESTAPPGTVFQVYVNRLPAWSGTDRRALLSPIPDGSEVQVGAVDPRDRAANLSAHLPAEPAEGWPKCQAAPSTQRGFGTPGPATDFD